MDVTATHAKPLYHKLLKIYWLPTNDNTVNHLDGKLTNSITNRNTVCDTRVVIPVNHVIQRVHDG